MRVFALNPIHSQIFFGWSQRRLFQAGLPLFTYHHIARAPAAARDPFLYVTPERFAEQLATLARHGFVSGTLADWQNPASARSKKVILTFDDGYVNVLENALPILAQHRFGGIQFIVADLIGARNEWDVVHGEVPQRLMDKTQIRAWLAAGNEIGSHSGTHRNLARLADRDLPRAREEIFGSKKKLEDNFGAPIKHFCYPHGQWNAATRDLVGEAGYETACTTAFGVNTDTTPRYELKRIVPLSRMEWVRKVIHRLGRKLRK